MADVKMKKPDGTWVSLKGPKGDPGDAGAAGADGATGPAGADGAAGPAGADGRSVTAFAGAVEPVSALAGDIWFED
jgi:hypothetical protein